MFGTKMGLCFGVNLNCRCGVVILVFFACAFYVQVEMVLWCWGGGSGNAIGVEWDVAGFEWRRVYFFVYWWCQLY